MPDFSSLQAPASVIADLAGVLALILSLCIYFDSRRDKQPRLTVGVDVVDFEGTFDDRGYPDTPPMTVLFVDIANPSERRVKVASVTIEMARFLGPITYQPVWKLYPDFQASREIPTFLVPGNSMGLSAEFDEFEYWMRKKTRINSRLKYRPIVHDAIGNSYYGNWSRVD